MSVAVSSGQLDLFAPKFSMDGLGIPNERVTIRVQIASKDGQKKATLFGTYVIGGRHAQISSQRLIGLGRDVNVLSIDRFSLKDFVQEFDRLVADGTLKGIAELRWENGRVWLLVKGNALPTEVEDMYVSAGRIWAILVCQEKHLRIALGDDVELFDMSRRRLSGMRMKGEKLMLEREFQNIRNAKHDASASGGNVTNGRS